MKERKEGFPPLSLLSHQPFLLPTAPLSLSLPLGLSLPLLSAPLSQGFEKNSFPSSDAGRVQHHPHPGAQRRRRQVLGELGPDRAGRAVRPRDAAPDDAELLASSGTSDSSVAPLASFSV